MIHRIYIRDTFKPFDQLDRAIVSSKVLDSGLSVDGAWMWFDLDTLGTCLRETVDAIVNNGHMNLSIKRNPDLDSIVWETEDEVEEEDMGLDSEESIGLGDIQGLDVTETIGFEEE
jgi:hypothetical protein